MKQFINLHRKMILYLVLSIVIIFAFSVSENLPEWFPHAGALFTALDGFALSYVAAFIFYLVQVYYPDKKRYATVNKNIKRRLNRVFGYITEFYELAAPEIKENLNGKKYYSKEDLKPMMSLKFNDEVSLIKAETVAEPGKAKKYNFRELIFYEHLHVSQEIDQLMKYYTQYLSPEITDALEKLNNCFMMGSAVNLAGIPGLNDINAPTILQEYYDSYKAGCNLKDLADML